MNAASALTLAAAATASLVLAARAGPTARIYLRFAASLYAAFAATLLLATWNGRAELLLVAESAALLVATLAPVSLALATRAHFFGKVKTATASIALLAACSAGLAAVVADSAPTAFLATLIALASLLATALSNRHRRYDVVLLALSAAALCAGTCALAVANGSGAFALFSAAALTGITAMTANPLKAAIEKPAAESAARGLVSRARAVRIELAGREHLAEDLRDERRG